MLTFTNDALRTRLRERFGRDPGEVDYLPFGDLAKSVRDDVEKVRAYPFARPGTKVSGFVYDVKTGRIERVA